MVVIGIFVIQIILVSFAGKPFGIYNNYGLTIQQWFITVIHFLFR